MEKDFQNNLNFAKRHIGLSEDDEKEILKYLGFADLEEFITSVIPNDIRDLPNAINSLPVGCDEKQALVELSEIASKNSIKRSLIGLGYHGTAVPSVILRHVLENPCWYSAYTPYQAEISQGRLEALFNYQTFISELTGLPIANSSLLDESTAAAEAMAMSFSVNKNKNAKIFLVDQSVLPQTFSVLRTRAEPLCIELELVNPKQLNFNRDAFGLFLQLPASNGEIWDPSSVISRAHELDVLVTAAIDPLFQVLTKPIGDLGVDIAVGSTQRLGVPIGFGGPHAAFFATREKFKRQVPGRIVGKSVDRENQPAFRLALQTREQHIRRDKATSNICTAQVLLAVLASFYAVHHGASGLEKIARRIVRLRYQFEQSLREMGYAFESLLRFDTIEVYCSEAPEIINLADSNGFNLRALPLSTDVDIAKGFGITFDELSTENELFCLQSIMAKVKDINFKYLGNNIHLESDIDTILPGFPLRESPWLTQPVFNLYHNETDLMRYIYRLSKKDFSLVDGMIPLGSCTMKLNAASELIPIGWEEFSAIHPFAPEDQFKGYKKLIHDLETWLAVLTGFDGVSLQPNAGSQGELTGLLVIRAWHKSRGEDDRNICLIPSSAHGTNPASAVMSGYSVVPVDCDSYGNVDIHDLQNKARLHSKKLAALMVTYPSTHGVFEPNIREICRTIHLNGGQVYLDGANMNAQVGLCRPGTYGADVCHLNLHKTFAIPHGGGGPGVGPIAVAAHLLPFLPGHSLLQCGGEKSIEAVSSAPFGSAGILPISWMYIRMMGSDGLRKATSVAILSANFLAKKLNTSFPVLFKGPKGFVAHECILDFREVRKNSGIQVEDIAKRLMDYGFHAPTVSWPVAGTLMVEPTESESFNELNRFCDAMISIRAEIKKIENGYMDKKNNPLMLAPHTLSVVTSDNWDRPYTRQEAAFPATNQEKNKFWPAVSRIDNVFGDRNLVCTCPSMEDLVSD